MHTPVKERLNVQLFPLRLVIPHSLEKKISSFNNSSHLKKDRKEFVLEPNMSDHGPGTLI